MVPTLFSYTAMNTQEVTTQKSHRAGYEATLYRSAFAIRKELKDGLDKMVELAGAPSVSGMLSLMAREPEKFADLVREDLARVAAAQAAQPRRRHKVTMKSVMDEMKSGGLTPEEIAAAIAAVKAAKAGAA